MRQRLLGIWQVIRCALGYHPVEVVMEQDREDLTLRFSLFCPECGQHLPADGYWREEMYAQAKRQAIRAGYPNSIVLQMVPDGKVVATGGGQ